MNMSTEANMSIGALVRAVKDNIGAEVERNRDRIVPLLTHCSALLDDCLGESIWHGDLYALHSGISKSRAGEFVDLRQLIEDLMHEAFAGKHPYG